jgi:hypothetical protein
LVKGLAEGPVKKFFDYVQKGVIEMVHCACGDAGADDSSICANCCVQIVRCTCDDAGADNSIACAVCSDSDDEKIIDLESWLQEERSSS